MEENRVKVGEKKMLFIVVFKAIQLTSEASESNSGGSN